MRSLKFKDVGFTITAEPEDLPIKGNAMASGDEEYDAKVEQAIYENLQWNEWAWCCVKVTAEWQGFTGSAYLGGCSYTSKKDFMSGGYYPQMRDEALEELNNEVKALQAKLSILNK